MSKTYDIGSMLNKAIAAVEEANDALAGVLKNNIINHLDLEMLARKMTRRS